MVCTDVRNRIVGGRRATGGVVRRRARSDVLTADRGRTAPRRRVRREGAQLGRGDSRDVSHVDAGEAGGVARVRTGGVGDCWSRRALYG